MSYYAGIGSRETPIELKPVIKQLVEELNNKGYILRSGGAPGADSFFEEYSENSEIFLPWRNFNNNTSTLFNPTQEAFNMAEKYHPNWKKLSYGAKKLMARNTHQILGEDLKTPVDFVICWTKNGKTVGGTGQALRIAEDLGIPIYNLYFDTTLELLKKIIK